MSTSIKLALLAGIFFGTWPMFMNRSGLNAYNASLTFTAVTLVAVSPLAIWFRGQQTGVINWVVAISAGLIGAIGVLVYNHILSKASKDDIGNIIAAQVLMQVVTGAVCQAIVSSSMNPTKIIGFALAAVSVVLISKG